METARQNASQKSCIADDVARAALTQATCCWKAWAQLGEHCDLRKIDCWSVAHEERAISSVQLSYDALALALAHSVSWTAAGQHAHLEATVVFSNAVLSASENTYRHDECAAEGVRHQHQVFQLRYPLTIYPRGTC